MTVPSTPRKAGPFTGNGSQTSFPFTFKVFAAGDVAVTLTDSLGVDTTGVLDTDYSVTLNPNQETSPGGAITYPLSGSALAADERLTVVGDVDYDQPLDLPNGGNFSPVALENQLDRVAFQVQQLREIVGRALRAPVSVDVDAGLPSPVSNTLIGWNVAADGLQNFPLSSIATSLAFARFFYDQFVGDGVTTNFLLTHDPATLGNLRVSVDGLNLTPSVDYTLALTTVVFTVAPALNAEILAQYGEALPSVELDAAVAAAAASAATASAAAVITQADAATTQSAASEADADAAAASLNAIQANASASSILSTSAAILAAQAEANALLGLGIASSYIDADGHLIMTYSGTVTAIAIDADGHLELTY